ncbi:MAG: hypothetical protein EPO52_17230 [Herbiconiux sp.]|uniref:hypothetical protein n=1 Tax=Herbiconiux sp. TaxID=1871186 RepID=UPI0011FAAC3E|nr:hypothetical protein [Herbiconiux sp.]TAJ46280.1 MAG: hypothetical protein EPO52_17230 [Herbiconiux sp.]
MKRKLLPAPDNQPFVRLTPRAFGEVDPDTSTDLGLAYRPHFLVFCKMGIGARATLVSTDMEYGQLFAAASAVSDDSEWTVALSKFELMLFGWPDQLFDPERLAD